MTGKHELRKKAKNVFADVVVAICLAAGVYITVSAVEGYRRAGAPIPADVISALFLFWGGELLVLCLRQVFGSDVIHRDEE